MEFGQISLRYPARELDSVMGFGFNSEIIREYRIPTAAAGISKLFLHAGKAAEVVNQNGVLVCRCTGRLVDFIDIHSTSNTKYNHLRPRTTHCLTLQQASFHLQSRNPKRAASLRYFAKLTAQL